MNSLNRIAAILAASASLVTAPAIAAEWGPTKPVRFIVGFPPGGATDLVARIMQPKLSASLGSQVIVDNRPGANGVIALQILKNAEPDGHSVAMGHIGGMVISPAIQKVGYDVYKDFAFLTMLVSLQNILIVHPSVPAKNLPEFLSYAKAQQGKVNYASSGVGSPGHLAGVLLETMTKIPMTHVPYKGGGPAITDLLAGHIPAFMAVISTSVPHVQSGKVRAIGVTGANRSTLAPEYPTIAELGYPGFEMTSWYGVLLPAKSPQMVTAKLNAGINEALASKDVIDNLKRQGLDGTGGTPEVFAAHIRSELAKWAKVVKDAGIKAD